ncbi:metal ABC transporter solute-binding protein, Zn/Mn family [Rhodopirellula halodulae]|uniref:metal ABC transporter solute-binding protein, Zn/Mn family n=1 Tax=Rhodopirellula halodulae TaxID=2894198 RepID=UPI001E61FA2A|nr:zinc ABC transporter substrate-binding protein [Rhodopirellula sp. JC737]MCC9655700.1 zinc ABC transporter substrate-binding protein [Rhodopirellula sp. JC737]
MTPTQTSFRFSASWIGHLGVVIALLPVIGCTQPKPAPKTGKLRVLATTTMVGDVVKAVGGDNIEVQVLLGPGVDPHLYKVVTDDVRLIVDADVVFYSGLMLEGKMTDTLAKVGDGSLGAPKPVHAITDGVDSSKLLSGTEQTGHPDPHVWFDVELWATTADEVAQVLSKELPAQKTEFQQNAKQYQADLEQLAKDAKATLATIPEEQRILITSHDAFGYLGRAYDIEVMGVQGISTDSEAGLQRINQLVDLIIEKKVPAVFVETSVNGKSIQALIAGAKSRGHEVVIGGELFSDSAGDADTYEGTYPGMIDHNVTTITRALGGEAPERGLRGKLSMEASTHSTSNND